jgi:tricorn protease
VVTGDAWDAGADSPLNAVGVEAKPGEHIVAVNGQRTSKERPPQSLLVHQAGTKVELTLASGTGAKGTTRDVLVTTLADEVPARYREWVERNRAWVHERSSGRVGYFHLPDMMSAGFAEFHRYFRSECDRDALIVDVRYNRGGHVSELLLEKVARKRIGYNLSRWSQPASYPDEAVAGPVVALTNEHAGSDGDIFSHGFKLMGIGPLVGTRTWGGLVGVSGYPSLMDGGRVTAASFGIVDTDGRWIVENEGVAPDHEVFETPKDCAACRDPQLEKAVALALEALEKNPPKTPPPYAPPNPR